MTELSEKKVTAEARVEFEKIEVSYLHFDTDSEGYYLDDYTNAHWWGYLAAYQDGYFKRREMQRRIKMLSGTIKNFLPLVTEGLEDLIEEQDDFY